MNGGGDTFHMVHVQEEYAPDRWRPSVPVPFFLLFGRTRCECGRTFRSSARYEAHYRIALLRRIQKGENE